MEVYFVDGIYELFRYYFVVFLYIISEGVEVVGICGVFGFLLWMFEDGVTYVGVVIDWVVEFFWNDLFDGYKIGEGIFLELFV